MEDDNIIGYCKPPKADRWKPGQSGNPKGRPKSGSEIIADAADILSKPVSAQTSDGRCVQLDAVEAGYLALCKKGLTGHKASLLEAIRTMLDVGFAEGQETLADQERRQVFLEVGSKLGFLPRDDTDD